MFEKENLGSEEKNIGEFVRLVRAEIGTLPDFSSPSNKAVEAAVEKLFADETEHIKSRIVDAFLASEKEATNLADA